MSTRIDDRTFLPIEGFVSGLLTCIVPALLGGGLFMFVGFVFGIVIATHVRMFRGAQSPFRPIGFIGTCTLAYIASVFATMWTPFRPEFLNFSGTDSAAIDSSPFLTGGFVGAAIICAGIFFFLAPPKDLAKSAVKALCISIACGFLGVMGWAAGGQFHNLNGFGNNIQFYVLYIIWQTGAAFLFGFLLSPQQAAIAAPTRAPSQPPQTKPKRGLPVAAAAFFAVVFAALGWFVVRQVRSALAARRMHAAQQAAMLRLAAEEPSSENLPPIAELPVEQVMIQKPIAQHPCSHSFEYKVPGVNFLAYTAQYKASETSSDTQILFADVNVRLYANSAWAVYATNQGIDANLRAMNPESVSTVTKFGNRVIMDTSMRYPNGGGDLYFYWASGTRFVQVRFFGPEDDEFLREYLARYPSDL
jgi:hypothetical protein